MAAPVHCLNSLLGSFQNVCLIESSQANDSHVVQLWFYLQCVDAFVIVVS
jgi:hypothetical protein